MKCFYHHEIDAVGICKNCNRGLCPGCAVEITDGIACRGKCEQLVAEISSLVSRNARFAARRPRDRFMYGLGMIVMVVGLSMVGG